MQQDKKRAELEQVRMFEQEKEFETEIEIEKEEEVENDEISTKNKSIFGWKLEEVLEKKKRREVVFEMVLFFVLGVLLGVTIKTEAVKKITIGFNDYQIVKPLESYNVDELKKILDEQIAKQQAEQQAQPQQ